VSRWASGCFKAGLDALQRASLKAGSGRQGYRLAGSDPIGKLLARLLRQVPPQTQPSQSTWPLWAFFRRAILSFAAVLFPVAAMIWLK
jgi:hypothetical protein